MIQISPEHRLTISFTHDDESNDIKTFVDIISKCDKEVRRSGYKNMFKPDEKEFIKILHDNLNERE